MKHKTLALFAALTAILLLSACGEPAASPAAVTPSASSHRSDVSDAAIANSQAKDCEPCGPVIPPEAVEELGILSVFTANDLENNPVDQSMLADYDLTMINVWATFCGPCLREMPDLGELAAEYQEQGVQIVGLVSDVLASDGSISADQVALAQDITTQTGADYPHLLPSPDLYGILSQVYAVPTTFFVDSKGRQVGKTYVQSMNKEQWKKVIDKTLEEVRP